MFHSFHKCCPVALLLWSVPSFISHHALCLYPLDLSRPHAVYILLILLRYVHVCVGSNGVALDVVSTVRPNERSLFGPSVVLFVPTAVVPGTCIWKRYWPSIGISSQQMQTFRHNITVANSHCQETPKRFRTVAQPNRKIGVRVVHVFYPETHEHLSSSMI